MGLVTEVFALQSLFEGLFIKALEPKGAFREALRQKGFDVDHRLPRYPATVWVNCVDVAAGELYPKRSREAAWEVLGEHFIEGYFQTLIGRMIGSTLPFLSPRTFLMRAPRFISTGLENAVTQLTWEDERTARLVVLGSGELAGHLMAGVFRRVFIRMNLNGVQLVPRVIGPLDGELTTVLP